MSGRNPRAGDRSITSGLLAGVAGTTALNATTYLDMVVRGRPASTTPEQVVAKGADLLGTDLGADPDKRAARQSAAGALLGMVAGVGVGGLLGMLRGPRDDPTGTALMAWGLAMVVGNGPMTVLGVTDPRRWSREDWVADVVPHVAYALAATGTLRALRR